MSATVATFMLCGPPKGRIFLKNSNSLSASNTPDAPHLGASQRSFGLVGPSRPLDPGTHAVRPDLADIRLAEYVFAPHYAAPLPMVARTATALRAGPGENAVVLAMLAAGDNFEALDFAQGCAWGTAPGQGMAGYVVREALDFVDRDRS